MKSLSYIFLSLSFVCGLQAGIQTDRPESQPNLELTSAEKRARDVSDFFTWEAFGYHALSVENEDFIRAIIKDLEMQDYCIEIRGMSNLAKAVYGRVNAFVVPTQSGKKLHAYLYVSEEWFDSLVQGAKEGLIRHELMHLRQNHVPEKVNVLMLSSLASFILNYGATHLIFSQDYSLKTKVMLSGSVYCATTLMASLIFAKKSRATEMEADILAAQTMDDKQGMIDLFENMKENIQDPKSKYAFKRSLDSITEAIFAPLSSHPELDERISYIESL
ncbi:MAG: M48 family metalloprotease [Candidatus Babeliales bacterium]|nr:M48 family metalloprotease [Candidatus Babeliales bacterium]